MPIRDFRSALFTVFLFGSVCCAAQDQAEDFSLVKQDGDIYIYERWVTFPRSKPPVRAREVKGEFIINSTIDEALALIKDETKIKIWQKHVSEFKVYPLNDTLWHEYSYHDIPWPVSDQDHFLEYKIINRKEGSKYCIAFETKVNASLAPVKEDVTRMVLSGSWTLEQLSVEKIKATYRIISMPSSIPRIFTDPVIRSNMMSTIKGYIKILESEKLY